MKKPVAIKFNMHNVTNGVAKARVFYSLDNRTDGRLCVTLYAKDYEHGLKELFANSYENRTDTMTDLFDQGNVTLFEDNEHYAAARQRAEAIPAQRKARIASKGR